MTPERSDRMVQRESGLLGVSATGADVRDSSARGETDVRAAGAIDPCCGRARSAIGDLAAVLGGQDALVFSVGIGENSREVRRRAREGVGFLGIALDPARNASGAPPISTDASQTGVRVIRTEEEARIAREVIRPGVPT
jgi:acetate kinase